MSNEAAIELPRYKCHKEVWALKIARVASSPSGDFIRLNFDDERYAPIDLEASWANKHSPQAGGYYVVYADGYKSFSPADAFEGGYTLIQ